jgi:hypothetical protein
MANLLNSQENEIKGKPVFELFTDFHYHLAKDTVSFTGFNLNRAYFGYEYTIDENFAATAIIDIGNPTDLAAGSKSRRYAHFREASVRYSGKKLTVTAGITGTRIFMYQQKFWGKRYVANTYQSINGYGYVADLGVIADIKVNDIIEADFSITNGEGYSSIQLDNSVKGSIGLTITPLNFLSVRIYSDLMRKEGVFQNTLVGFIGIRTKIFYIGAEASFKSNLDLTEGHNAWGISSTAGIQLSEKNELFCRYDYSTSVIVPGDFNGWNYAKDGSFLVGGIQHTLNKYIKAALNFQSFYPFDANKNVSDFILVNLLAKF